MAIALSFGLILAAGLCEIGARYWAWQWLRAGWSFWFGVLASAAMLASLFIPVFQGERFQFGRSSAAYGVNFVLLALLWSWKIDRKPMDLFDFIGAALCLSGMVVMMYWPRG
ncbi:MAG: YnfA family protein [Elusimicrobia bacterium]|nr:YnfA family protein [Elusimicrobiota bacterium]